MYILFLDTTHEQTCVALYDVKGICVHEKYILLSLDIHARLLSSLSRLLKLRGGFSAVRGVAVVPGPGRFTSVRLGIVAANAVGYALDIPVIVVEDEHHIPYSKFIHKKFKPVVPVYGKEPNITIKK